LARVPPAARSEGPTFACGAPVRDLQLLELAFILEMSLSKPIGSRLVRTAVTAPRRLRRKVCRHQCRDHQLALAGTSSRRKLRKALASSMAYSNKMIKEDHLLACTTRMLEILVLRSLF